MDRALTVTMFQNISRIIHEVRRLYITSWRDTILFAGVLAVAVLSVLFVVTFPNPIRPRTSVGMLSAIPILLVVVVGRRFWETRNIHVDQPSLIHYGVIAYFLSTLLSVIFCSFIQDSTPIRLLFSGVVMYLISKHIHFTSSRLHIFVHVLGFVAVCVAVVGLLQVLFPSVMNGIADVYLKGREAYGITIEFNRGRLLHWGMLVFIYPFFYSSILLLRWKDRIWTFLYVVGGTFVILWSLVASNFRWGFLVFVSGSVVYAIYAFVRLKISTGLISKFLIVSLVSVFVGLIVSKEIFGYNLVDRFLLQNSHRDVVETFGRITLFNQAITVFTSFPVVGAGYGNYYSVVWPFFELRYFSIFDQFSPYPVPIASHNEFLTVLAETGLIGLVTYVVMVYAIGKQLYTAFQASTEFVESVFFLAMWVSFLSIYTYVLVENMYPQNNIFILLMAGIAAHWSIIYKPKK